MSKGAHVQALHSCTAAIRNFLELRVRTVPFFETSFDHRQKLTNGSRNLDWPISYCLPVFNYDIIIRFNLLAGGEAAGYPASIYKATMLHEF